MYKKVTNKQGLTLLEFIIILALICVITLFGINKYMPDAKEQILDVREYVLKFLMKKTIRQIDQIIRYSENIQALPRAFIINTDRMDTNRNYLMVSSDGKRIVKMEHDGTKFIEKEVFVRERKNVEYEIFFEKKPGSIVDNTIRYEINVYIIDEKENTDKRKVVFESSGEPIGTSGIIDKGTGIPKKNSKSVSPSVALSYTKNR